MTKYLVSVHLEVTVRAETDEEALRLAEDYDAWEDTRSIIADGVTGAESEPTADSAAG